MDRFIRFLRQLAWVVGALGGLILLAWIGVIFYTGYWLPDPKGLTADLRTTAVFQALSMSVTRPSDYVYQPCEGEFYSPNNRTCFRLSSADKRNCRWWLFEDCKSYSISDLILKNPDHIGAVLDAVLRPCKYLLEVKKYNLAEAGVECNSMNDLRHAPIIIVFEGHDRQIRMRID